VRRSTINNKLLIDEKFYIWLLALILLPAYMSAQVIKGKVLDKNGIEYREH
jgi:hypothetical protein